jgi:hypothetical protein
MIKLKFGKGNAKLSKDIYTFSLPAGHSCPFAFECKTSADRETGKITDGSNQIFRCFSASAESLYPAVRKSRWHNYDQLKGCKTKKEMVALIEASLPKNFKTLRVHVSGDFYNQNYFDAWMEIAEKNPDKIFYAYTKSIVYWIKRMDSIPENFKLTSSMGGKKDELITKNNLKFAKVVFDKKEAIEYNMEIDHDDSHAYKKKESFALLIHGTQKSGTFAATALSKLKKSGVKGYSKKIK